MKTALTIAGSDSGGGAGIQADLKTFEAHGLFGMSVITSVTAQNTLGIRGVWDVSLKAIHEQIEAVFDDLPVHVIKLGMLSNIGIVSTVADLLEGRAEGIPIVLDPVIVATSGDRLLAEAAIEVLISRLLPLATITTPNVKEAEVLSGRTIGSHEDAWLSAEAIVEAGASNVLITSVDAERALTDEKKTVDLLLMENERLQFTGDRIRSQHTHGTGCTLSSAIAANLGLGLELEEAIERAKNYVYNAILNAPGIGNGHGPLRHAIIG